jgi:NAD(P)H-nitrite reductase large subunit
MASFLQDFAGKRIADSRDQGSITRSGSINPEKSDKARGDVIVCRCERVYLSELVAFIKENKVRDINQLKSIRVGMGACGGKTCSQLVARAFSLAGVDASELEPSTSRPLFMEIPMGEIVNEGLTRIGGKQAGERGAP